MPGIVGLIGTTPREEAVHKVKLMLDAMSYEPFYSRGLYVNEMLGLYAGWLVHPKSFSDCMPVVSEDRNIALLFHGELFAAEDQLASSRHAGHRFSKWNASHLVGLYQELGQGFFHKLNGTFCGILLDSYCGTLQIFNDRMGYEKLYCHNDPATSVFHFASEAKSLLRVIPATREFDRQGVAQFLRYGCTFDETTLYKGISLLPPGSVWEFAPRNAGRKEQTFFIPQDWRVDPSIRPESFPEAVSSTLQKILPRYFEAEIPPAMSLTGGWDTRMILACHRAAAGTLSCYTFAGITGDTVDVCQAKRVAAEEGQDHQVLRLQSDFLENFEHHAEKTVYVSDGYGGVSLSHEIYLNRLARNISQIRLTGNFGSEVLRGATTFKEIPLGHEWFDGELHEEFQKCREQWRNARREENAARFAVFKEIPWKLATIARLAGSQLQVRTPYLDNEIVRLACVCPPTISGKSVPPWVVGSLSPRLGRIPTDRGESVARGLGEAFRRGWYKGTFKLDYLLSEGLPGRVSSAIDSVAKHLVLPLRHKFLDYRRWFSSPLKPYVQDVLGSTNTFVSCIVGKKVVDRILRDQAGNSSEVSDINALLTLQLIDKCLLRAQRQQTESTLTQVAAGTVAIYQRESAR